MEQKEDKRCAYFVLDDMDEDCAFCNGNPKSCSKYTTIDHLEQFDKMFIESRGLEDKTKGVGK